MAYVLNKVLDNDICDELNKLTVNDTIIQLKESLIKEKMRCESLTDVIDELEDNIAVCERIIEELEIKIDDCESTIIENKGVDIDALIVNMTNGRRIDIFTNWIDGYGGTGIAYDIAKTYKNFDEWYNDVLHCFLDYFIDGEDYNVSFDQFFKAKKLYEETYDEFDFDLNKDKMKTLVVYILLKERFQDNETKCVKFVIAEMKEWYEDKIEEEAEDE